MNRLIYLLLFFYFSNFCIAEEPFQTCDSSAIDTSFVDVRSVDMTFVTHYKRQSEFQYSTEILPDQGSFWRRFLGWLRKKLSGISSAYETIGVIFKILLWLLLISILVFAGVKSKFYRLFYSGQPQSTNDYKVVTTQEEFTDLDTLIKQEVSNKNFRKAIRYQFLILLDALNKNGLIAFSAEKTNYDYIRELKRSGGQKALSFQRAVEIYNAVWYGHFDVSESEYRELSDVYVTFKNSLYA